MALAVLVGLVFGAIVATVFAPALMLPLCIGGALTGGSVGAAYFMFAGAAK